MVQRFHRVIACLYDSQYTPSAITQKAFMLLNYEFTSENAIQIRNKPLIYIPDI